MDLPTLYRNQRFETDAIFPKSDNDEGFVTVVITLLMLVMVTIIGVSSLNLTVTETMIVRADAQYKRNFYFAESAGYEASQRLENTPMTESNPTGGVAWVVPRTSTIDLTARDAWIDDNGSTNDFTDDSWTANSVRSQSFYSSNPANPNLDAVIPGSYTTDDIRLASQFKGVAGGSSLDITGSEGRLYNFSVYGMYSGLARNEGEVLIEMGYRKRF